MSKSSSSKRHLTRAQLTNIVNGVVCFVLIVVVLQLWLLTATMNAFLGGDSSVVLPALAASTVCLLLNLGLLRYLSSSNTSGGGGGGGAR